MLKQNQLKVLSGNLYAEPDNYMHSFRENIRMYLEQKGITLAEVSELADMPEGTLKTFVYGKSADCHLSTAIKLAKVFNVSIDELVGAGTIAPQTCDSLQTMRLLPDSFTHFVRWIIHFHHDMVESKTVPEKSIEIMQAETGDDGNLKLTNYFSILDVSYLNDDIRPKTFMGIKIPNDLYAPLYFQDDILLIANDRLPRPHENVLICVGNNIFIARMKYEIINGQKKMVYYSVRDDKRRETEDSIKLVIGYVVKVHRDVDELKVI